MPFDPALKVINPVHDATPELSKGRAIAGEP
jgi:hypothetical protein